MKKILFPFAALVLALAISCNKESAPADNDSWNHSEQEPQLVELTFTVPGAATRVTDLSSEDAVSSLQVFIIRTDSGLIETSGYSSNSASVSLQCYSGTKDFVAIANVPEITDVTTYDALREKKSMLTDNSVGKLVMYGHLASQEVSSSETFTIPVTRLVARIGIVKITNNTKDLACEGPLVIKKFFLLNVAGDRPYDSQYTYSPGTWYNKQLFNNDCPELLCSEDLNRTIAVGGSYTFSQYFYCYPNPTLEDTQLPVWQERFTRICVLATLNDIDGYYSVTFEGVKSNYTYTVTDLKVQNYGGDNPDMGPVRQGSFEAAVSGWGTGSSGVVEF